MLLSKRVSQIIPSPTLSITAQAKRMKAEGIDVISFGAGEPDFDTPAHIKQAAKRALDEGFTKYTPASGMHQLKEVICQKFRSDNSLQYLPGQILISCGAKHSIFNAIFALCDEGDEVILPSPYWVSYPEMIKASGAKQIVLKTNRKNKFKIMPEQLRKAITPRTKLLILNSPSNPTGMVYTTDELKAIAGILIEAKVFCLSDEIYEKVIYDDHQHISIASLGEEINKLTIVINGVSKSYSMTGFRIGYAAADIEIIQAMSNLQSHSTSNPASICQIAAIAALSGSQEQVKIMVGEFKKRRDYMIERLNKINGFFCLKPQGAFYAFVDISTALRKTGVSGASFSFTQMLLSEAKVAVVPGKAFGADEYLRFSYATSHENINTGLTRIERLLKQL